MTNEDIKAALKSAEPVQIELTEEEEAEVIETVFGEIGLSPKTTRIGDHTFPRSAGSKGRPNLGGSPAAARAKRRAASGPAAHSAGPAQRQNYRANDASTIYVSKREAQVLCSLLGARPAWRRSGDWPSCRALMATTLAFGEHNARQSMSCNLLSYNAFSCRITWLMEPPLCSG